MNDFLNAVLPWEKTGEVFVGGTLGGKGQRAMLLKHATTHAELAKIVANFDTQGQEAYFALARYIAHTSKSGKSPGRQGKYATTVKSLWLDLDCGEDKATAGDGYASKKMAAEALRNFLTTHGLPMPSYMVDSGGGVHVYFAMTEEVRAEVWQPVATKLKDLCIASKFLADKSRTDDIASVLRPPGTHNHKSKYGTPRPVVIKYTGPLISFGEIAAAIDGALSKHDVNCKLMSRTPAQVDPADGNIGSEYGPPDLDKLRSALSALDPDCEEPTWKFHRIAPLAHAAKQYPDFHAQLKELGRQWSRGDLHAEVRHDC